MKGVALGVVTADCVPVILYDAKNKIIGCVHAGWKGAYLGIIKNTINKIKKMSSKQCDLCMCRSVYRSKKLRS